MLISRMLLRVRLVFIGACLSQTYINKFSYFFHISLGSCNCLRSSQGYAKISARHAIGLAYILSPQQILSIIILCFKHFYWSTNSSVLEP